MKKAVPAPSVETVALRDYFAAQVLAGMASRTNFSNAWARMASANAYALADAMLIARGKK